MGVSHSGSVWLLFIANITSVELHTQAQSHSHRFPPILAYFRGDHCTWMPDFQLTLLGVLGLVQLGSRIHPGVSPSAVTLLS